MIKPRRETRNSRRDLTNGLIFEMLRKKGQCVHFAAKRVGALIAETAGCQHSSTFANLKFFFNQKKSYLTYEIANNNNR